jgi:hypothetical protein
MGPQGIQGEVGPKGDAGADGASAVDLVGTACTAGGSVTGPSTFQWVEITPASGDWFIACKLTVQ